MKPSRIYVPFAAAVAAVLFVSCASIPKGASVIGSFDANKYLGKWYEIARFDFAFERDLDNTTAEYSLNADGSIKVDNRGFNYKKNESQQALGQAKLAGSPTEARLLVSFFGPFYAAYNVIALEGDYQYALVAGANLDYLWILSRTPSLPDDVKVRFLAIAKGLGYDLERLVWVKHDRT